MGVEVTPADRSSTGGWDPLIRFPLVPVAAAMLPDGKVLTWAAFKNDRFAQNTTAETVTATYDPASEEITEFTVTKTNHDMFCPGIATLGSGAIVVTGGDNAEKTSIYDPDAAEWLPGPDMTIPRGYQATTLTSEGKVRDAMLECRWSHARHYAQSATMSEYLIASSALFKLRTETEFLQLSRVAQILGCVSQLLRKLPNWATQPALALCAESIHTSQYVSTGVHGGRLLEWRRQRQGCRDL